MTTVEADGDDGRTGDEVGEEMRVADRAVGIGGCRDDGEDGDGEHRVGGEAPEG